MIKVSRSLKELAARAAAVREKLIDTHAREPSVAEIAAELGVDAEDVAEALEAARPYASIYEPAYGAESDAMLLDTVGGACRELDSATDRVALKELLNTLSARERTIITLRYFRTKRRHRWQSRSGYRRCRYRALKTRYCNG